MDGEREKLVAAEAEAYRLWIEASRQWDEADRQWDEACRKLREFDERRSREEG
jgi:hypothetical protein